MRSSGILLHITSLPNTSGVGTLAEADRFVDFLRQAGQKYWQILPITPTDFVNSPYASPSAFAGNTLVIDAEQLLREGLVSGEDLSEHTGHARGNDYGYAIYHKDKLLRIAFGNFLRRPRPQDYDEFCRDNSFWLEDYALFCALKQHFGGKSWLEWPDEDARMRNKEALEAYSQQLCDEIAFVTFCQYVFNKQWAQFRAKLTNAGIKLIGDIPIYVAYDSADVWAHPQLFDLTKDRRPNWVAGVPPDYFSEDGQLWGNPLYDWDAMKKENFDWWTRRVGRCSQLMDVLRIDHFRAFDSYYAIRYGEKTARKGHWCKGIGYDFLKHLQDSFPELTIIAEDLGDIPKSVLELRDKCGLAGMKVMQFAYDGNKANPFLPQNFEEHCVAYLGTHDNDTTLGWWNSLEPWQQDTVLAMTGLPNGEHIAHNMIEILADSCAELVVFSMQDIAEDGTEQRMNTPGTLGCWKYMAHKGDFSRKNAKWLAGVTERSHRLED